MNNGRVAEGTWQESCGSVGWRGVLKVVGAWSSRGYCGKRGDQRPEQEPGNGGSWKTWSQSQEMP